MATVSVLMVTYNHPKFIADSINSLLRQSETDWELLIVDDSETVKTQQVLDSFLPNPRIHYFYRGRKMGYANALNYALDRAQGRYIAILDDDDVWLDEQKLKKQINFMDGNVDYIVCGGRYIELNEATHNMTCISGPTTDEAIRSRMLICNGFVNSSTLYRRSTFRYDENSIRHTADWELWLRLGKKGKFYNFDEYFTVYRIWPKGGTSINAKEHVTDRFLLVWRYRKDYPGSMRGLMVACLRWIDVRMPEFMRLMILKILSPVINSIRSWLYPGTQRLARE